MKYCSQCGHAVEHKIPEGDNRSRAICNHCKTIHYINPKIVAGTIPVFESKVLLCKRAIEPRLGLWTLPAGFMEMQETATQAAIRETWEEALAEVAIDGIYTIISIPHIGQVHIFFRASLTEGKFGVGNESLETNLFSEEDVPWNEIAFPTVKKTLRHFFNDRKKNKFPVHTTEIIHDRLKL